MTRLTYLGMTMILVAALSGWGHAAEVYWDRGAELDDTITDRDMPTRGKPPTGTGQAARTEMYDDFVVPDVDELTPDAPPAAAAAAPPAPQTIRPEPPAPRVTDLPLRRPDTPVRRNEVLPAAPPTNKTTTSPALPLPKPAVTDPGKSQPSVRATEPSAPADLRVPDKSASPAVDSEKTQPMPEPSTTKPMKWGQSKEQTSDDQKSKMRWGRGKPVE